jgi:hypothetical protein
VKRRVVLLGPPVSGKGTQAELIRARYKIPTTSTGAETITIRMAQRLTCTRCGKIVSVGRHVSSVKEPARTAVDLWKFGRMIIRKV